MSEVIDVSDWDIVHLNASPDYISEAEFLGKDGSYRELVLEVESMTREMVTDRKGGKKLKDILKFKERTKRLILNKTNRTRIFRQHGRRPRDWYGKPVTFFFDTTEKYRNPETGDMGRGAIRVKE